MPKRKTAVKSPYNSVLWRAIAVFIIFAIIAPPVQIIVSGIMSHFYYIGGANLLLADIASTLKAWGDAFKENPLFIIANWIPVFIAVLWAAIRAGQGRLTLRSAALAMIAASLFWAVFASLVLGDAGGFWQAGGFYMAYTLLTNLLQWLISAYVCWEAARLFGLVKIIKR